MLFLGIYWILLITVSVFTNGYFLVTRGKEEVLPDGKIIKTGKILKGLFFFWTKTTGETKIYYQGEQLDCLIRSIKNDTRSTIEKHGEARILVMNTFEQDIPKLQALYDVCIEMDKSDGHAPLYATIYKVYPKYIFPEWVRDMMAECVTCHATVYGNIGFWVFVASCKYTELGDEMGAWQKIHGWVLIFTWLSFWMCLAWLNTWLYQRVKH